MTKADWGEGPWQSEPDKLSWTDTATGLPCLIVRNRMGALCGYVGVDKAHPWYACGYAKSLEGMSDLAPEARISVHGGLTYSDTCQGETCHGPELGKPDDVWWLGFDCNHIMDYAPGMEKLTRAMEEEDQRRGQEIETNLPAWAKTTYRDVAYVKAECASLAKQLVEVAKQ